MPPTVSLSAVVTTNVFPEATVDVPFSDTAPVPVANVPAEGEKSTFPEARASPVKPDKAPAPEMFTLGLLK